MCVAVGIDLSMFEIYPSPALGSGDIGRTHHQQELDGVNSIDEQK